MADRPSLYSRFAPPVDPVVEAMPAEEKAFALAATLLKIELCDIPAVIDAVDLAHAIQSALREHAPYLSALVAVRSGAKDASDANGVYIDFRTPAPGYNIMRVLHQALLSHCASTGTQESIPHITVRALAGPGLPPADPAP